MAISDYYGKICPYCKTEITENDNIVVCSNCEMPHHKECWISNQGCTTFGCTGTIKAVESNSQEVEIDILDDFGVKEESKVNSGIIYCTKCGAVNDSSNKFCGKCGNRIIYPSTIQSDDGSQNTNHVNQSTVQQSYTGNYQAAKMNSDSDMAALIGNKAEYYLPRFNQMKAENKKTSWNWCSFLFAPFWMLYRRLYLYGAIYLGACLLIAKIITIPLWSTVVSFAAGIILGLFGNYIYMQAIEKKVNEMSPLSPEAKQSYLSKNAGTNILATVIGVVCYLVVWFIIYW